jgi:hypothetical protein
MSEDSPAERDRGVADEDRQNGYEEELAQYESELARYLESRIKPGLSRSAIPLMARSIAKEIARREPPEPHEGVRGASDAEDGSAEAPDFEADMHELQAELGEDWILRFSVQGEEGWLTAEKADASQRVEAPDAQRLVTIVDAINDGWAEASQ